MADSNFGNKVMIIGHCFIVRFDDLSGLERSDYSNVTIHNLYRDATECIYLLDHNDLGVSDMLGFRPAC